jgi:Family of unknown function (DUF6279)
VRAKAGIILVLFLSALLGACSSLRLAYDNADAYARWRIDSYVTLQGDDADTLDEKIDEFHAWHRRHELPQLAGLAKQASQRIGDGLSPADLVWGYDSLRMRASASLRKGAELVAPLLDRLTAEQIGQIERRVAEENRKFFRDNLRGAERERREKRAKVVVDRLEDWVGKLTQAQVERVREYSERAPMTDELRDRDRKRLQRDIIAILRAREAQKRLPERLAHWDRGREPAYVAQLDAWRQQYFMLLVDLERSLSAEQRGRLQRNLRRYIEDFEALAAQ